MSIKVFDSVSDIPATAVKGKGTFAAIREELAKYLQERGQAVKAWEFVKLLEAAGVVKHTQMGYNYLKNAVKSSKDYGIQKVQGVNHIVRITDVVKEVK